MQAKIGDEIIVQANQVGAPDRSGRILDVRGEEGRPPYVVRWSDDAESELFFPGPDAMVKRRASR